jgi:acyl-CoA dehydrogenase
MDFELSEEMKMIRSLARDFVVNELRPLERNLLGRSANQSDARATLTVEVETDLVTKARNCGLWGVSVPEELGGMGLGTLANCLIEEELAQTVIPFNFGDVSPILFGCNESQRSKYLTPVLNHKKAAYFAFMEPGQYDKSYMKTTARKHTGYYVLNGVKSAVARQAEQYFTVVFALLEERESPTCFFVDPGSPGFSVQIVSHQTASTRASLLFSFKDCRVPEANMLGEEGKAFALGRKWLPSRRVVRSARSVGVAQRLLEEATTRAQTTQWFGRVVSESPSVRSALVEIAADIHACRLLVYEAASMADEGKYIRNEASMAKLFADRMIRNVSNRVAHIYGGPGKTAAENLTHNITATRNSWAVEDLQRDIIARQILKGLKF